MAYMYILKSFSVKVACEVGHKVIKLGIVLMLFIYSSKVLTERFLNLYITPTQGDRNVYI